MVKLETKPVDVERAKQIWMDYQMTHDVSHLKEQFAAIDPVSGGVWIGPDAIGVIHQKELDGNLAPVYMIRVGYDYFVRKGRR